MREEKEVRVKEVLFYDFLGEVCFIAAIIFLILFKKLKKKSRNINLFGYICVVMVTHPHTEE